MKNPMTEAKFETAIEDYLLSVAGYQKGKASQYDKQTALFPDDVIAFIQKTQGKNWQRLENAHKHKAREFLLNALVSELNIRGALEVLRGGFRCYNRTFQMAYFAPNSQRNPEIIQNYQNNIVKITRQVVTENGERPDIVLSVNGIPVVTMELKNVTSGTHWTVENAMHQYRYERNPKGKLFEFKKRTLVHFALDTDAVYMTTQLDGANTRFLPFNRGNHGSAGNPPTAGNFKTAYLWESVLTQDGLLDILGRFLHLAKKDYKIKTPSGERLATQETMIFPRFHQLDAVRKLIAHSKAHGAGHNYLIQHSAGSGKSNTIAWLAHQLSVLHNASDEKLFHSVIVVTDRVVLDRQLQATISQFEQTAGVVQKIDEDSKQLATAIAAGTHIIITTIQKFPFVMNAISQKQQKGENIQLETKGKRFAVIVDEAHSSQSGETAAELRKVLNSDGIAAAVAAEFLDEEDGEDLETQKALFEQAAKRQRQENLSFFAFTATPKPKTLALFDEAGEDGKSPFHHYTMKQAIEEGFILDVLASYTTYGQYFKLLQIGEDKTVYKNRSKKELLRFVQLHPSAIVQKVEIIVEHFRQTTMQKIGGRAKAMVVTSSREAAVRYKLAFDEYIRKKGYQGIKSLVAFSGSLSLKEAPEKEYTEAAMNGISEAQLPDTFNGEDYRVLLVAEKYQTGFDQPLLHTMFVDKRLSGIQAVQTLSRLNRIAKGKEDTFVLDFVNTHEDIYKAFKPFYEITELGEMPDLEKLNQVAADLDAWQIYTKAEIDEFCALAMKSNGKKAQQKMNALLDTAVSRYLAIVDLAPKSDKALKAEQQKIFIAQIKSYLRLYPFIAQIIDYSDTEHEARHLYLRSLQSKLPQTGNPNQSDIADDVVLHYYRLQKEQAGNIHLNEGEADPLKGATDVGTGKGDSTDDLSQMIEELNEAYGTEFTAADQLFFEQIIEDALGNENIMQTAKNNPPESFAVYFETQLWNLFFNRMKDNEELGNKVLSDEDLKEKVAAEMIKQIYKRGG
ncbi:type I restriction endonuclease subunit R [Avibacterium avium]|uniref:type I restriction endonuclease subunit R n=1 Tax=Avibacterium avium TaxID=751 RepID=UPI003BF8AAB6